jgi:hypothetical protein
MKERGLVPEDIAHAVWEGSNGGTAKAAKVPGIGNQYFVEVANRFKVAFAILGATVVVLSISKDLD